MRLLRYSCVAFLAVPLACVPAPVVDDDDSTFGATSTGSPMTTTTTGPAQTDSTTTDEPDDGTTTAGVETGDTGSESGSDTNQGQECGNGVIEGTELCDCGGDFCSPAGLGGAMCAGSVNPLFPDRVYTGGILDCNPASCQLNFNQCSFCGDTVLNGNEICELDADPGPSCQQLGMGTDTTPLGCGLDCQWDTTCCEVPLPKECM